MVTCTFWNVTIEHGVPAATFTMPVGGLMPAMAQPDCRFSVTVCQPTGTAANCALPEVSEVCDVCPFSWKVKRGMDAPVTALPPVS